jgi:hypothetical protein
VEEILAAVEQRRRVIKSWGMSLDDLHTMVAENPHVYSPLSGFVAEYKCRQLYLERAEITDIVRPTGYDKKEKGDFKFTYRGERIGLEVKSLDTPKVCHLGEDRWVGQFQCNASDARMVLLPNGEKVSTNCIVAGGWDVLAVSLSAFGGSWRFAFARQSDLPRASVKYAEHRAHLLATVMKMAFPVNAPFSEDLMAVLDTVVRDRKAAK